MSKPLEFIFDEPQQPVKDKYDLGCKCPACGSYLKRYYRSLNANIALALICVYRYGNGEYVPVEELMRKHGYKRSGDFSYAVHWNFLQKKSGLRNDGSKNNGLYRLTASGLMFVEGKTNAKSKIMILQGNFEGFSGVDITIEDALGKAFNYSDLMAEPNT